VLRAGNITEEGLAFGDLVFVPKERISNLQKIRQHDVVVAASSGSLDVVGKAAPALTDFEGGFGAFCKVLRPNAKVDPYYFAHFFKTLEYRRRVSALAAGANINNLRNEHLDEMQLPLPSLPEQRRIAAILEKADKLRAQRCATLSALDALTDSIFYELFGNLAADLTGWPVRSLKEACAQISDCPHSTPTWADRGVICLRTSNLTEGGWNWSDTRYVIEEEYHQRSRRGYLQEGDIVLSREGTVGIAAIVPKGLQMCMGQRLVQLRPLISVILPAFLLRYLLYVLSPSRIARVMVGSTSQHLNVKELKELRVPVPPLELQQQFANTLVALNGLKEARRASLDLMNALFASLQYRAFRGEL